MDSVLTEQNRLGSRRVADATRELARILQRYPGLAPGVRLWRC